MSKNYVDISGQLHREMFHYDKETDRYRVYRPFLDAFVDLLLRELEHMKRKEKQDG